MDGTGWGEDGVGLTSGERIGRKITPEQRSARGRHQEVWTAGKERVCRRLGGTSGSGKGVACGGSEGLETTGFTRGVTRNSNHIVSI